VGPRSRYSPTLSTTRLQEGLARRMAVRREFSVGPDVDATLTVKLPCRARLRMYWSVNFPAPRRSAYPAPSIAA